MISPKARRLRNSVYRLGYALYAKHLMTGDGRTFICGKGYVRDLAFEKFSELRTKLYKEEGILW